MLGVKLMADKKKYDKNSLIFNLAKYTYEHGPIISGTHAAFPLLGNLIDKRDELLHFVQESIILFEENSDISEITYQILSNANQQIDFNDLRTLDEVIDYVSNWMEKISERQELLPDEKLVMQVFSSDIYLTDLDIDKIASRIVGLNED